MSIFVIQYYLKQKKVYSKYNYIEYGIIETACKIYVLYKIKLLYNLKFYKKNTRKFLYIW